MTENNFEEVEKTVKKKYQGEATATQVEIDAVGGEKTLLISNVLFQTNTVAQSMADLLLNRLKERKDYFEVFIEFCPVPIEIGDIVRIQEYVRHDRLIWHICRVRQIRLSITSSNQSMSLVVEEV